MLCDPEDDYSSDEDEDYIPTGEASEGESGDDYIDGEEDHEGGHVKGQKKGGKKKQLKDQESKRSRRGGIHLQEEEDIPTAHTQEDKDKDVASAFKMEELKAAELKKEEKQKQKADDLWSSFLKDVGTKPKAEPLPSSSSSSGRSEALGSMPKKVSSEACIKDSQVEECASATPASKKTVTITQLFDFAGEEVKLTKEVAADSKEAKELLEPKPAASKSSLGGSPTPHISSIGSKRPGGGLGSVLGLINKKPKISVLEKSRIDWNSFTTTEGITDDLKIHNKGKGGYVEKQKFLAQADQRQYEMERDLRLGLAKR